MHAYAQKRLTLHQKVLGSTPRRVTSFQARKSLDYENLGFSVWQVCTQFILVLVPRLSPRPFFLHIGQHMGVYIHRYCRAGMAQAF